MREIQAHCDHIYKLAIDADDLMRRALSSLYGEPVLQPADVVDLLKRREVLDLIKKSVERCEVIGDLLHGVAVKHA